jgi:hypothetical protein
MQLEDFVNRVKKPSEISLCLLHTYLALIDSPRTNCGVCRQVAPSLWEQGKSLITVEDGGVTSFSLLTKYVWLDNPLATMVGRH